MWQEYYKTFRDTFPNDWLPANEQNEVEKLISSNSQNKYKYALDFTHKYLREHNREAIENRKKRIKLGAKRFPKRLHGIPNDYPTKLRENVKIVVVGEDSVGKTSLLYTFR